MAWRRALAVAFTVGLVLGGFAPVPAQALDPLVADAGESQVAVNGAPLRLGGRAFGGDGAYSFAWDFPGPGGHSRFDDRFAADPSFDTAGLPDGDVVLELAVTDGSGASAGDTAKHRVLVAAPLLDVTEDIGVGVPDEFLEPGFVDFQVFEYAFDVAPGTARLDAVLDWENAAEAPPELSDLDFYLYPPASSDPTGSQGATSAKPERIAVASPAAGAWRAVVEGFLNGPDRFHLLVTGLAGVSLPSVRAPGPYEFGVLDTQALLGEAAGGASPAAAWDLDLDGVYEAPGLSVVASLPPGAHTVALKAVDANGYEARVTAPLLVEGDADRVLKIGCGPNAYRPLGAMEFTSSKGTCWMHGGHHTYFLGDPVRILRGKGFVFTVEQQFSPPAEAEAQASARIRADPDHADPELRAHVDTPVRIEASLDGLRWLELGSADFRFLTAPTGDEPALEGRQGLTFELRPGADPVRFLRFAQPPSLAQGLSGFLDHSQAEVAVDVLPSEPAAPGPMGEHGVPCERGLLEDFFASHPCTFGGIDRYDAPSFWHTYFVGDGASLTRVRGTFTVAPWRTDDWFSPIPLTNNLTRLRSWASQVTTTNVTVETSGDGFAWDPVGKVEASFGVATAFDLALGSGRDARFVRLFPDYHPRFDQPGQFAPNHHPEAFFLHSGLVLEGTLPV